MSDEDKIEAVRQRATEAEHRLMAFRQARAARDEALRQFIKERAPELWPDYAAVSANGSLYSDGYTLQPNYEREMNKLRWRVEDAERRATEAEARLLAKD